MGMWIPDQDMEMVEEVLVEMVMVDSMETVGSLELVLGEVEAFEDEDFHVTVQELNTEEVAEEEEADTEGEIEINVGRQIVMDVELTLDMEEVIDDAEEDEMVLWENASNAVDNGPLLLHPDRRVYMFTQAPRTHCCHQGLLECGDGGHTRRPHCHHLESY